MTGTKGMRGAGTILLGAAALFAAGVGGAADRQKAGNPHGRKDGKVCVVCHVAVPAEGDRVGKDSGLRFGGDVSALCSSCHKGYRHAHPLRIAVAPDLKSPDDLPLDREGKITCITCHDPMEGLGVHTRRKVEGRALCLNCHVDSDILAQVAWYPTYLKKGAKGRLELKVVDFRVAGKKSYIGESVLLYYYAKNVDTGEIVFGTNILYDDGSHGDRAARDSIYTLIEEAPKTGKKRRLVYTGWVLDAQGRRSNTVTLAVQYE